MFPERGKEFACDFGIFSVMHLGELIAGIYSCQVILIFYCADQYANAIFVPVSSSAILLPAGRGQVMFWPDSILWALNV